MDEKEHIEALMDKIGREPKIVPIWKTLEANDLYQIVADVEHAGDEMGGWSMTKALFEEFRRRRESQLRPNGTLSPLIFAADFRDSTLLGYPVYFSDIFPSTP